MSKLKEYLICESTKVSDILNFGRHELGAISKCNVTSFIKPQDLTKIILRTHSSLQEAWRCGDGVGVETIKFFQTNPK
jgi:hypothetical protein